MPRGCNSVMFGVLEVKDVIPDALSVFFVLRAHFIHARDFMPIINKKLFLLGTKCRKVNGQRCVLASAHALSSPLLARWKEVRLAR